MTYLRLRKSHRTQPGLALAKTAAVDAPIEILPVTEIRPQAAAVTIKPKRAQADPAVAQGTGPAGTPRSGTLHKPVHAA